MEPLALILAVQANRALTQSALPNAPVEPPEVPRPHRSRPLRQATAAVLYRLADFVEPSAAPVGQPATH